MYDTEELRSRIGKIEEYLELGRRLEQIVNEPEIQGKIKSSLGNLITLQEGYNQRLANSERTMLLPEHIRQIETRWGGEKKFRDIEKKFDECNHVKEGYANFGKAMIYGLVAGQNQ